MEDKFDKELTEHFKNNQATVPAGFAAETLRRLERKRRGGRGLLLSPAYAGVLLLIFAAGLFLFVSNRRSNNAILVTFRFDAPAARSVALAGDFNNWHPGQIRLKKREGEWYIEVKLPPGRYQYNYVVDGKEWLPDPAASLSVDNGFGQKNSVIDLTKM